MSAGDGPDDRQSRRRQLLAARRVLLMVHELHLKGFQLLRACPYFYATGSWRCAITPASNTLRSHGARLARPSEDIVATYTSASGDEYFGWADGPGKSPRQLAKMFLERFPHFYSEGYGADWEYAGWFVWMLAHTELSEVPYAYSDWESPGDRLLTTGSTVLPLPPPGDADGDFDVIEP